MVDGRPQSGAGTVLAYTEFHYRASPGGGRPFDAVRRTAVAFFPGVAPPGGARPLPRLPPLSGPACRVGPLSRAASGDALRMQRFGRARLGAYLSLAFGVTLALGG